MPTKPSELLEAAKRCFQNKIDQESDRRSCISRAYYAAYHCASNFHSNLKSPGISKDNCGEHWNLIHMLQHPTVDKEDPEYSKSLEVQFYLKKMLYNRRLADYDLDQHVTERNVTNTMIDVDLVFDAVK